MASFSSGSSRNQSGGSHSQFLKFFKKSEKARRYNTSDPMPSPPDSNAGSYGPKDEHCAFEVGVSEDANRKYRRTMEDSHTYICNFAGQAGWGYFAVFDGHAGYATAQWCSKNMHTLASNRITKSKDNIARALYDTFTEADDQIGTLGVRNSGCTAAVAILRPSSKDNKILQTLYVANVGDARVVLSRSGKALRLSYDHKGSDPNEKKRIMNLGGIVVGNRVNGMLAVTRSLGDTCMKEFVTGAPYTTETELTACDKYMIISCDGLWDVCGDQKACELIEDIMDPAEASRTLIKYALEHGSSDNLTCMVVRFDWGEKAPDTPNSSS